MEVYLHREYRQFTRVRTAGEIITVRDAVGAGLVSRAAACPVVDGEHQCQMPAAATPGEYLDEMLDSPDVEVMLPSNRWSHQKLAKMKRAYGRSVVVRRQVNGRRLDQVQAGELR